MEVPPTAEHSMQPLKVTVRIGAGSTAYFHICRKCMEDKHIAEPKNQQDIGAMLEDMLYDMVADAVSNQ